MTVFIFWFCAVFLIFFFTGLIISKLTAGADPARFVWFGWTPLVKWYWAKNDTSPFTCHLFSRAFDFMEARKTCHQVDRTSVWSVPYSGELCNKNCIVKTLISWSTFCEGVPDRLLKRAAKVFRVDSKPVELLLTYWCSQRTLIVNFEEIVYKNWTSCLN